jgi:hypothetical protein
MNDYGFPKKMAEKNAYFVVVVAYLILNATRLAISSTRMTDLTDLFNNPLKDDTWVKLFLLWSDKKGTRTSTVSAKTEAKALEMEHKLSEIYDNIPPDKWTDDDRGTLHRSGGKKAPKTKPGDITDECILSFEQFGGGKMKGACKSKHDQTRASKAKNSDGVQLFYTIADQYKEPKEGEIEVGGGSVKLEDFKDPNKAESKEFFSSATFTLELGKENSGRRLLHFVRWYHSKYKRGGPWMGPFSINIQ